MHRIRETPRFRAQSVRAMNVHVIQHSAFPSRGTLTPGSAVPLRIALGIGAGLASMGFVLGAALSAPRIAGPTITATAISTCPDSRPISPKDVRPAGNTPAGAQIPATVKAAP